MAKLTVLAFTLLIALFVLAEATTYTTTVTTITTDESGNSHHGSRQECQQQIQEQQIQQLQQACRSYLSQGRRSDMGLRMIVGQSKREDERQLQECCQQLENINSPCRCQAIGEMVKRQSQQGEQQLQKVLERAQNLPRECNMKQPQRCQIQPYWF